MGRGGVLQPHELLPRGAGSAAGTPSRRPRGPRRGACSSSWAWSGCRGRPLQLARMCGRVLPKIEDAKRRDRVRDLRGYMLNNADCVVFPRESMGTMEGTNAYVGAARMKGRGMSWS